MTSALSAVRTTAPGRVCLFGEHVDYLGLPVIAAAISMRMTVEARLNGGVQWVIEKPDLGEEDRFALAEGRLDYAHGNGGDFLRAVVNVLRDAGCRLPAALSAHIRGEVPIQAGTSSSSALQVAWTAALLALSGDPRAADPEAVAHLAYVSEVHEFDASGGMMDQFSSALGGLVRIDPGGEPAVKRLPAQLGAFVLGDSLEAKDTQGTLTRVKAASHRGADWLREKIGEFDWRATPLERAREVAQCAGQTNGVARCALGALRNRDLLVEGERVLAADAVDHARLGALLTEHHAVLRDALGISTPKIEQMLDAALDAGALGGKINGSGGGGCMFAYAPDCAEAVADAIGRAGGKAWGVTVARGLEVADQSAAVEMAPGSAHP